jgi:sialidase-1
MKIICKVAFCLVVVSMIIHRTYGQSKMITVFESGTSGYNTFRIPAIIRLPNKSILAFCEGRVNSAADFGNIKIVMKKSSDNGATWSDLKVVVDANNLQAGNPAPVIDLTDTRFLNGRIFLFYNTGNNPESEIRKGNGCREVWYKTSVDNGENWSEPVNITTQVHKPKQPLVNADYHFLEDWRSYANTPGHAIQIQNGKYKGRIFIAANHSVGEPKQKFEEYYAHAYYTDDHANSFKLSESLKFAGSNESTSAELSNDKIVMNSRNQKGNIKARIVSYSSNGGQSWDTTYFDTRLFDPVNEASILNIGYKKKKAILAFCNTNDSLQRNNLTLRISYDEGKNWNKSFVIDKTVNARSKDFTAYSDLIKINNKQIGVLYERDGYKQIVFTILSWK